MVLRWEGLSSLETSFIPNSWSGGWIAAIFFLVNEGFSSWQNELQSDKLAWRSHIKESLEGWWQMGFSSPANYNWWAEAAWYAALRAFLSSRVAESSRQCMGGKHRGLGETTPNILIWRCRVSLWKKDHWCPQVLTAWEELELLLLVGFLWKGGP